MVSALWKACSDGDLERVSVLLNDGSQVDLDIKDHAGVTPLIAAVQNGHVEVVRMLLSKGADANNVSSQGPPEQYTSDSTILELLSSAKNKMISPVPQPEAVYVQDPNVDAAKGYYPPPGGYYYPGMPPPPMLPEGAVAFYPPPPPHPSMTDHNGMPNLPPPEIARMIPCRYYPACRYGTSCMFAHPQGPYLSGPLPPPAQYPAPYDPMAPAPYPPPYYPVHSPSFQSPPGGMSMNPISPTLSSIPSPGAPHHMARARSGSELMSPVQAPFSPTGMPPQVPYGVPVSPTYGHAGPIPMGVSPLSMQGPHSPQQVMYPPTSPGGMGPRPPQYPIPTFHGPQYPPHAGMSNGNHHDLPTSPRSPPLNSQSDLYGPGHRENYGHNRRGSTRRPSFGVTRKPPCLFYPAGRCKNGDDCRFPHVLQDGPAFPTVHHPVGRGGHRSRPSIPTNGTETLENQFATLTTQDNHPIPDVQRVANGVNGGSASNGSSRSQSTDPGSRGGRSFQGYKSNHSSNGHRAEKKYNKPQRLPSADEFPVLAGSSTPPLRSPGAGPVINGWSGPTAAQVLQAPAPSRKDSQPGTRGGSPENGSSQGSVQANENKLEVNEPPVSPQSAAAVKLPVSFAAISAPDAAKEVSVSA